MLPGAYDLELYRGDTVRRQFALWQDAERTVPVDLSGAAAAAQIRVQPGSLESLVGFQSTIDLPNLVNIALSADTAAVLPAQGFWDLQITYPGGDVKTILTGIVLVLDDVTRPV